MKLKHLIILAAAALLTLPSCKDTESYADMLRDETYAVNDYLTGFPVINSVPVDTIFRTTADILAENPGMTRADAIKLTPFYRVEEEGNVYMQVINPGTPDLKAKENQEIYFRFTRYNLCFLYEYGLWDESASGNAADLSSTPTSFRYKNTTLASTTQWGTGIQTPLDFLSADCEVNLVVKSYVGLTDEVTNVYPYLYQIRYFPSKI